MYIAEKACLVSWFTCPAQLTENQVVAVVVDVLNVNLQSADGVLVSRQDGRGEGGTWNQVVSKLSKISSTAPVSSDWKGGHRGKDLDYPVKETSKLNMRSPPGPEFHNM